MYQSSQVPKYRRTSQSLFLSLILLSLYLCFLPNSQVAWAQNNGSTPSGMQTELKLKDGTTLKGEVLEQNDQTVKIKTLLGTLSIPVENIVKPRIRLKLNDGSVIQGLLVSQTDKAVQVLGMMGQLNIDRANIESFQLDFNSGTSISSKGNPLNPNETQVIDLETGRTYRPTAGSGQFENNIEPLIDMFFDPTANVFNQGDVYISGLSLAYGMTSSSLISVNLVNLVGLNQAEKVNPNVELKWQPYFTRTSRLEHGMALGLKAQTYNFNGFSNYYYNANGQQIRQSAIRHHEGYLYSDDRCDEDATTVSRVEGRAYACSVPNFGWQTQLYIAQSVSWLMKRGGRFSLHAGANIELNALNYEDWVGLPANQKLPLISAYPTLYIGSLLAFLIRPKRLKAVDSTHESALKLPKLPMVSRNTVLDNERHSVLLLG